MSSTLPTQIDSAKKMKKHPLVSIGMPVYNEAWFTTRSLEALVTQDYPCLELIISDNASTDGTSEIAQEFATRHEWIRYHRFDTNQGPAANFKYVLDQSTGKYFLWAAGHDLWSSNFIFPPVSHHLKSILMRCLHLEAVPGLMKTASLSRVNPGGPTLVAWTRWHDTSRYFGATCIRYSG